MTTSIDLQAEVTAQREANGWTDVEVWIPSWAQDDERVSTEFDLGVTVHWYIDERSRDAISMFVSPKGSFVRDQWPRAFGCPMCGGETKPVSIFRFVCQDCCYEQYTGDGGRLDLGITRAPDALGAQNDLQVFFEEWVGLAEIGVEPTIPDLRSGDAQAD